MNNYYQMRMEEMLSDGPFLPRKEILTETTGNHIYYCPICGRAVGMYNIGKWHRQDEYHKEDWICVNADSDYCTEYTQYTDTCEHFEQRGIEV